tara:strand:- start:5611 stop:7572 length:1962 start_codon:yes stop_codon:yes gene_type:complete
MLYKTLYNITKGLLPKISETELIALRSGTVSIDRDIMSGVVKINKKINNNSISKENLTKVEDLLTKHGDVKVYPNNESKVLDYLQRNKFYSYIIDEEYGGNKLSVEELSGVLTKITSKNPALGVTVMVPNSLGPGELLINYGTEEQKSKYLPGLADGRYVPCFGLTGPYNGSDATGLIDTGRVCKVGDAVKIQLILNKRYITLAPIANLIGVAFKIEDPDNLLGTQSHNKISVALLERWHPGLKQDTYHNPLDVGFPNGTLKGEVLIDPGQIIGGVENSGNGWKMLMECLAAGRGICLPATANASSKVSTYGLYNYCKHRKQFNIPLIKMQGVQEKLLEMVYQTWVIQSSISLTNVLLDSGEKPAVISAIMKQQTTERARIVLNNAMDIYGGSGICIGDNNFLERFYKSAPIGITVEGSNTLTRSLIIFGQGLNKSHPYIFKIVDSLISNKEDKYDNFRHNLNNMIKHVLYTYTRSLNPFLNKLDKQTINFAHLCNYVSLKGGKLKGEQYISGDMADIFSNLYLAHSMRWFQAELKISDVLSTYCINRLINENQIAINRILNSYSLPQQIPIIHLRSFVTNEDYSTKIRVMNEIQNNPAIIDKIKENVYMDTILTDLESLNSLESESEQYHKLYDKVIQVGEFKISPSNVHNY